MDYDDSHGMRGQRGGARGLSAAPLHRVLCVLPQKTTEETLLSIPAWKHQDIPSLLFRVQWSGSNPESGILPLSCQAITKPALLGCQSVEVTAEPETSTEEGGVPEGVCVGGEGKLLRNIHLSNGGARSSNRRFKECPGSLQNTTGSWFQLKKITLYTKNQRQVPN